MYGVHLWLLFCGTFWNVSFVGNGVGICRKSYVCKKWPGLMANYLITMTKSKLKKLKNKPFFSVCEEISWHCP